MSMCQPWATEILSLVAMNSTSCSRLPGCLSTSPKEVPAQAPAQAPQSGAEAGNHARWVTHLPQQGWI